MLPTISIIVPVYNKERYLHSLWEDLFRQSYKDYECILIDDGSTDQSGAACNSMVERDSRFRVYHTTNQGVSHARNIGLDHAKGKYVIFVDADDHIPENYLQILLEDINNHSADISICTITKVWESGHQQKMQLPGLGLCALTNLMKTFAQDQSDTGLYGYCPGKIFLKQTLENVRFDEKIRLAEDFEFLLRIYSRVKWISFTNKTAYYYMQEAAESSALIPDDKIDYRIQLTIRLRYRDFLKAQNAYCAENKNIVSQLLSNYVFYTIFYCDMNKFDSCLGDLKQTCNEEEIELRGRSAFEKWIFWAFRNDMFFLVKLSLKTYYLMRSVKRIWRKIT